MFNNHKDTFPVIKKCMWDESKYEPYYNTGQGYVFIFDGAEKGCIWIQKDIFNKNGEFEDIDMENNIPVSCLNEFIEFSRFVYNRIKDKI